MKKIFITTSAIAFAAVMPASAATITDWNVGNVVVGATPADGVTGSSVVYDQTLPAGGTVPAGAETNGMIVFTPPEAVSPGIQVSNVAYADSGTGSPPAILDGCIKTSSAAACDGPFQSGKRIKQMMTGTGPLDLVFDIDAASTSLSTYQVFGRLINATGLDLDGFELTLGFGVGDAFVAASETGNLKFSTTFTAQPTGSGSSNTQFPFGLFGDATTNPNFLLDGFFSSERAGLDVMQTGTQIISSAFFGEYNSIFGPWMPRDDTAMPTGLFWDFDDDASTDALLMAWEITPGVWELRRDAGETCDPLDPTICTPGVTRSTYFTGTLGEVMALLGVSPDLLDTGAIEDLANLNLNYAVALGDLSAETGIHLFNASSPTFTLRTVVLPTMAPPAPVPLPAGAPLLIAALGAIGLVTRRKAP